MKTVKILLAAAALLAFATAAFAQQPPPDGIMLKQRIIQGPDGAPPPPPDSTFFFVASESFGGKIVKGAPYSAESVTESIQTLSDGNRIVNRITSMVYRDSEGRTRREQSLKGLGILGAGEEPLQTIFINDPVAGVTYSLDTRSRIANKSAPMRFEFSTKPGASGTAVSVGETQRVEVKVAAGVTAASGGGTFTVMPPPPGAQHVGMENTYFFRTNGSNANEVKEDLGKQNIEGVEAEGSRTKVTIPAGEIGNERPIEIVSESWYSPELQMVVMTRHSDPRTGETTYKLTNIDRTEPAHSLFEVPPGYTVKERSEMAPKIAPLPRKKSANPE